MGSTLQKWDLAPFSSVWKRLRIRTVPLCHGRKLWRPYWFWTPAKKKSPTQYTEPHCISFFQFFFSRVCRGGFDAIRIACRKGRPTLTGDILTRFSLLLAFRFYFFEEFIRSCNVPDSALVLVYRFHLSSRLIAAPRSREFIWDVGLFLFHSLFFLYLCCITRFFSQCIVVKKFVCSFYLYMLRFRLIFRQCRFFFLLFLNIKHQFRW